MEKMENNISILVANLFATLLHIVDYKVITSHPCTYHQHTYISPVFFKLIKSIYKNSNKLFLVKNYKKTFYKFNNILFLCKTNLGLLSLCSKNLNIRKQRLLPSGKLA